MATLDLALLIFGVAFGAAFLWIIWSYAKGLKGSPRELWLLYVAKIIEYSAYGSANVAFTLYLSADAGLGDIAAGTYVGVWSVLLTTATMLVGAVVDAIGIRKTLIFGTVMLLFARFAMPMFDDIYAVSILGFVPLAIGTAILGPVLSVGIKRFTTAEGATLGFGLFYTLMNVGWALGGIIFDEVRGIFGEHTIVEVGLGVTMSTYQIIFAVGFVLTIPTLFLVMAMREGVERKDSGEVVIPAKVEKSNEPMLAAAIAVVKKAAKDTVKIFAEVIRHKAFWYYIFMLGLLVFVRLVFYHFHYTFPKYGIRVLGEGVKIGNIYGVLNPMLIVFLVPFVAALSKSVSSYRMMIVGTTISAIAVFMATLPADLYSPLMDTWVGELVFDRWLGVPLAERTPIFLNLIAFIIVFTIGEAIWSPRLLQFTAEIAPEGREGSYIALSYLPYFGAKLIAGPLSGWLVQTYTPEGAESYPDHYMVWLWVGGMAMISPIGLVAFRKLFHRAERKELYDSL
jgi:MFS family permease